MSGLYLHIPFCKQACSYCDFYFVTSQQYKQPFVDELIKEIRSRKDTRFAAEKVRTIYFGGGTPSLLSAGQVHQILEAISETFPLELEEVTFEMNPDDVTVDYLNDLKKTGINRASMGVQSTDPDLLNFMHRAHTSEEALQCLELLHLSKFEVFTVDLIYGNPGQTITSLERDLDIILGYNPQHVSAYSLTIEPRTRLGKQVELGRIVPPEDDTIATHYDVVEKTLRAAGILQYEVSNFARPGDEAIHNSNYWEHANYLGFGPGAHSFWWETSGRAGKRWSNEKKLRSYLNGSWNSPYAEELLELPALAEERLMLGLRTRKGISEDTLQEKYEVSFSPAQTEYLHRMEQQGKVITGNRIQLTTKGLKIADTILLDLLTI
ncbi:MAG: radical SAM family heme chaperone HemW [Balneolaceae bacterium]|nr:radical SAM family heme chaperone HemW [Balneolaceae bacterium]